MPGHPAIPAFAVAGASSGSGKTLFTLGLMEALRRRGLEVAPFKAGPDYIDPGLHSRLLGRPSYNLDTWMMGARGVRRTFAAAASGADCAVVEGVMGLYDGRGSTEAGSTAHLAKTLGLPVVLVVNAEKASRSMGALVEGFESFGQAVDIRWVVFNKVGSKRHFDILRRSIRSERIRVAGYMTRDEGLSLGSRHLGLTAASDIPRREWARFVERAAQAVESSVDIQALLKGTRVRMAAPAARAPRAPHNGRVRIGVALDRAFQFYYRENLDILESLGAELVCFSPLADSSIPDVHALYIGGGYPELYARELEENEGARAAIRRLARRGLPIYAECGGLMYLGRSIEAEGSRRRMAGVFPFSTRLLPRRKALGYREASMTTSSPFLKKGSVRGHEFHYSEVSGRALGAAYTIKGSDEKEGFVEGNALASYIHLHFASNRAFAAAFVRAAALYRDRQ